MDKGQKLKLLLRTITKTKKKFSGVKCKTDSTYDPPETVEARQSGEYIPPSDEDEPLRDYRPSNNAMLRRMNDRDNGVPDEYATGDSLDSPYNPTYKDM